MPALNRLRILLPALVLLLSVSAGSHGGDAAVYRWVDADGRIHYGDKPPPAGAERVNIGPAPGPDPVLEHDREQSRKLLEVLDEDRWEKQTGAAAAEKKRQHLAQQCASIVQRLERVRNAGFIYERTDDPYNPRILSDTERQAETEKLEAWHGSLCK